ncbi:MAG TPA: diguanylate cyclase [Pirellulales bacterium]|jgi:diguanylate cyclase (GGDEF)-like protein/putative nucleotidyltransferase with HDIG domain/PAS domain S-box-containing protein|nr:diguanylate cyclase [Pirellulales bacterium]
MDGYPTPEQGIAGLPAKDAGAAVEGQIQAVSSLLGELSDESSSARETATGVLSKAQENQLIQVRLGIASSLFAALRGKHEPTAQHCLRVALACSAWAQKIGLPDTQRDELELAALLHDVGKIRVPDDILMKAGALSPRETAIMDTHWQTGLDILRESCALPGVLEIVTYARAWFDGSKNRMDHVGEQIPVGARMLTVVDAFDAMMSDHVYRRSLSLERAYNELYRHAGTQFDPQFVMLFIKLFEANQFQMHDVARRWLRELDPEIVNSYWRRSEKPNWGSPRAADTLFQQKLLDNMSDAVVFLDNSSRILLWNRGAERLTGISSHSVYQQMWLPSLLSTRDDSGNAIKDDECPISTAIRTGVQWIRRLTINGRGGRDIAVDAHAVPVVTSEGTTHGLTLLLHDVSPEISLEQRCRSLYELSTKDPLTQVANRAEFDRVHELFVAAHRESNRPCSLIMADIDHFKHVNDTYGHQAGDEVIQSFARLLQNSCRPGDLVARYGGEEFVLLCADCDNPTAARRAQEIRLSFAEHRQTALDNQCVTASFGVTEVQPGDTTENMLRRSDRALLLSKEAGRNRVVQLGSGGQAEDAAAAAAAVSQAGAALLVQDLITESPIDRTVEKLRGFIADHHGEIVKVDGRHMRIKLGYDGDLFGRKSDRPARLVIDLEFSEEHSAKPGERRSGVARTRIHVELNPQRQRDRRKPEVLARCRQLLISLRAYLMATEAAPKIEAAPRSSGPAKKNGGFSLLGWLGK